MSISQSGRNRPAILIFRFSQAAGSDSCFMYNCFAMIDFSAIIDALAGLPLGSLRFFDRIGSTNVEAARWAAAGAPDLALVLADEQTAGKGRQGRAWFTPPGGALAFSLALRPQTGADPALQRADHVLRFTALGTLAVCAALENEYGLRPQIKWPNDVLLQGRKLCGVLAESQWQGDSLSAIILGIGINIAANSTPPDDQVTFPATYLENFTGQQVDRLELLRSILESLLDWRQRLNSPAFIAAWDQRLAFKNEWVQIINGNVPDHSTASPSFLVGLDDQCRLVLKDQAGDTFKLLTGEVRLRPIKPGSGSEI